MIIKIYPQAPATLWTKTYGLNTAEDRGYSVIETTDGGLAIVGYTSSYGAGGFDVWLLKTNADGDTLWTRTYGGSGDDYGYSMKQTYDGGYIIGGATSSFGMGGLDYYLIKTDSIGDTLWTRTFGEADDDIGWSVEISNDGGYIIAGEKHGLPVKPDAWIIKVNSEGNFEWQKIYGTENQDRAYSVQRIITGGFIIAGYFDCGGVSNGLCGWLIRTDELGDTLWTKNFGGDMADWFQSVYQTIDGGYILTGRITIPPPGSYSNIWLLKTDSLGNEQWSKNFNYDDDGDIGYSVKQTIDGGYIIAGQGWLYDVWGLFWIIRTNSSGDILWTKTFDNFMENVSGISCSGFGFSVIQSELTGDYIVTGVVSQNNPDPNDLCQDQLFLAKIASDIVPVELTSFTATAQQNTVTLNWQTATETNNSGFEIERTSPLPSPYEGEGATLGWSVVGFVPGFGTTTEPKSYSFVDENLSAGNYQFRLKQIDFDGSFEYSNTVEVEITAPLKFALEQNYPNPFNPGTVISYSLPQKEFVTIKVIDILGREVATLVNEVKPAGKFEVEFDASSLASGVYVYQINAGSFTTSKKMLLTK